MINMTPTFAVVFPYSWDIKLILLHALKRYSQESKSMHINVMHSNIALVQRMSNSDTQEEQIYQQYTTICYDLCLKELHLGANIFLRSWPQATRTTTELEH